MEIQVESFVVACGCKVSVDVNIMLISGQFDDLQIILHNIEYQSVFYCTFVKCVFCVCVCVRPFRGSQAALVQEAWKALLASASRGKKY